MDALLERLLEAHLADVNASGHPSRKVEKAGSITHQQREQYANIDGAKTSQIVLDDPNHLAS